MPERLENDTHPGGDDPTADRLIAFLRAEGAGRLGHGPGRGLLDHLVGTYEIAGRWEQPSWLQHAALIHSIYGTEAYGPQLIALDRRQEVSELAGERAERLAHLFAITPRRLLFSGTHRWARGVFAKPGDPDGEAAAASRDELDALVLLHLANLAEQARAADGSPGTWLSKVRKLSEIVFDSEAVTPPLFIATLAGFTEADESACRSAYREGLMQADPGPRIERLALAAAACPVVAEPCVWLAYEARRRGEHASARAWAGVAEQRLLGLGVAWDKRLQFDEWRELIGVLGGAGEPPGEPGSLPATDPRALYDDLGGINQARAAAATLPRPTEAIARFQRYMSSLADAGAQAGRLLYPDLESRPWWEAAGFELAVNLEAHFHEIRDEVLALEPSRFAPESEPIPRRGNWDVIFLYERGHRHEEICDACPTTTSVIEQDGAMRTAAGLIYVSRMRPGTHIQAHRGPTNLRLRCHLGVTVPEGDCAIRVEDEARRWSEGRCLVFDDSFEHEAWNRSSADRIVLIVDLWHPGLSSAEVHLLKGLQRYAAGYARGLDRYWEINAAAREQRRER